MSLTRRQWLGGGLGLLGAAGLARATQQGLISFSETPGLKAWTDWNSGRHSGPLALVAAGLLAASPFNSQPWRFAIGRLGVDIFEVPERNLGALDPFGRARLAALGAAIHNMALASTMLGRLATVRLLPDPDDLRHVARIELDSKSAASPPPHPLLPAIGARHTHRGLWTAAPLTSTERRTLLRFPRPRNLLLTLFEAQSPTGQRFTALTNAATTALTADTEIMAAAQNWFRHNRHVADARKDGLTPDTLGLPPLTAIAATLMPSPNADTLGRWWRQTTAETQLPSASLFGLLQTPDPHDRRQALLLGMAWQRLHLIATSLGLVAQPLDQLPTLIDHEQQQRITPAFAPAAKALTAPDSPRPAMAFRIGRAEAAAPPSKRRPVSAVVGYPARLGYEIDRSAAETAIRDAQLRQRLNGG
jgi:hypothetical protein